MEKDIMFNNPINSKLIPSVGRQPFPAYRGNDKYIFVSYAHDDEDYVFSEIARYQYMKYNVWYDEGISPGNEWKEEIASRLINCDLFIIFLTENTVKSDNCRIEFYCALEHGKNIIPFYLEDFDSLPFEDLKWKEDLSEIQGILMTTLDEEEYVFKFTEAFQKFGFNYGGIEIDEDQKNKLLEELEYYVDVPWVWGSIFIDGTINDMHAERDFLIKKVFPELNEWCYNRHILSNAIDLRWGPTTEMSSNGLITTTLESIDKSRPFYICLLGQRRGWVPKRPDLEHDLEQDMSKMTKVYYPKLNTLEGRSLTEMGIVHALDPLIQIDGRGEITEFVPVKHAIFLFRDDSYVKNLTVAQKLIYTNEKLSDEELIRIADEIMCETKQMIRDRKEREDNKLNDELKVNIFINDYECHWNSDLMVSELDMPYFFENDEYLGRLTDFTCNNQPLKDVIINQLKEVFESEFPTHIKKYKSENEFTNVIPVRLANHHEFKNEFPIDFSIYDLKVENAFYTVNSLKSMQTEYNEMLIDYIDNPDDNMVCLVSGKEGYGKTTLLSNISHYLKDDNLYPYAAETNTYARFCGITESSSDLYSLWTSIILEAMIKNNQTRFYSYPLNYFDLFTNFNKILNEIASYGKTVIIIDGMNYLDNFVDFIKMIDNIPKNLKIIISIEDELENTKVNHELSKLKDGKSNIYSIELKGLEHDSQKIEFINNYLRYYLKELDDDHMDTVCGLMASENPLYLKILLSELVNLGSYDKVSEKIISFGCTPKDAFKEVLERLELDYGEIARNMFFLFEINFTLSPDYLINKLMKMSDISVEESRIAVQSILRELDDFVRVTENGCLFLNESLKDAIRERYG